MTTTTQALAKAMARLEIAERNCSGPRAMTDAANRQRWCQIAAQQRALVEELSKAAGEEAAQAARQMADQDLEGVRESDGRIDEAIAEMTDIDRFILDAQQEAQEFHEALVKPERRPPVWQPLSGLVIGIASGVGIFFLVRKMR